MKNIEQQGRKKQNQTAFFNLEEENDLKQQQEKKINPKCNPKYELKTKDYLKNSIQLHGSIINFLDEKQREKSIQYQRLQDQNILELHQNQSSLEEKNMQQEKLNFHDTKLMASFYPKDQQEKQTDQIKQLQKQRQNLYQQLSSINLKLNNQILKKTEIKLQKQQVNSQIKNNSKTMKNLISEYEEFNAMLHQNYCLKIDEEYQTQKRRLQNLKKQVHQLNFQLSRPSQIDQKGIVQLLQKQIYQSQIDIEEIIKKNQKKKDKLTVLSNNNQQKIQSIAKLTKQIYSLENESDFDINQINFGTDSKNKQKIDSLKSKIAKLVKINQNYIKNKEAQFIKKSKIIQKSQQQIELIQSKIKELNSKSNTRSKTETFKKIVNQKRLKTQPQNNVQKYKRKTPFQLQVKHEELFFENNEPSGVLRSELNQRKRRIYTELQRNNYFSNIENTQNKKQSMMKFKQNYNDPLHRIEKLNHKKIQLPMLTKPKSSFSIINNNNDINSENHMSPIVRQIESRFSSCSMQKEKLKKSIANHNKLILETRKKRNSQCNKNYLQICQIMSKDKLSIQEESSFQTEELIYY